MSKPDERGSKAPPESRKSLGRRVEKAHCVSKGGLRLPKPTKSPPESVETDREGRTPPNRTDTRTFVLHEPKTAPQTLPKPEILQQNGTPTLAKERNDHPNTHRDAGPTDKHPVNDHRLNDHPVKTTRKLGRRPHARRIAGGEGGGSLAPVPPPQDSGGGNAPVSGCARRGTDRRRARRQDSRRRGAAALFTPTTGGADAPLPTPERYRSSTIPTGAHAAG